MIVSIYLKDKKNKIESKYHQVTKKIESTCGLIHQKANSKFHREATQTKLVRNKMKKLIKKSKMSIESLVIPKREISFLSKFPFQKLDKFDKENIDWTRGQIFWSSKTNLCMPRSNN